MMQPSESRGLNDRLFVRSLEMLLEVQVFNKYPPINNQSEKEKRVVDMVQEKAISA